jgi:ABC-type branched-subunit amino acid transport system permease subunit
VLTVRTEGDLWQALQRLGPNALVYMMSFMTLGIFWVGQGTQLNLLARSNRNYSWLQLAFLLAVTLVPFSTGLLARFPTFRVALVEYWLNIVLLGMTLLAGLEYGLRAGLYKATDMPEAARLMRGRILIAQSLYAIATATCIFVPTWVSIALIFVVGCLSVFAIYRLANSRIGRAWMAMREDELAASAMGIDLVRTKLLAFSLGASFSGFAGSLWASMLQLIDPFQFDFSISIVVLAMIILGGIGNIWGVIFGGVVLGFYDRVLTSEATNWIHGLANAANVPLISPFLASVDLSQYKFGIFGLALVTLMLTRPEGIFPNRQRAVEMHGGDEPDEPIEELLGEEALIDRPVGGVRA